MFGIKILKTKRYWEMVEEISDKAIAISLLSEQVGKLEKDGKSLRRQLNDKMRELREQKPIELHNLHILKAESYPCDKCKFEGKGCKKLEFANTTICVCDKKDAESFESKGKKR